MRRYLYQKYEEENLAFQGIHRISGYVPFLCQDCLCHVYNDDSILTEDKEDFIWRVKSNPSSQKIDRGLNRISLSGFAINSILVVNKKSV